MNWDGDWRGASKKESLTIKTGVGQAAIPEWSDHAAAVVVSLGLFDSRTN